MVWLSKFILDCAAFQYSVILRGFFLSSSNFIRGEKYVCIARTVEKGIAKHGMFKSLLSIGLGCQIKYAKDFVYTDSLNLNDKNTEVPIGVNCRTCDRMDCQQRAFPPLHKKFDIDLNKRGISVYVAD